MKKLTMATLIIGALFCGTGCELLQKGKKFVMLNKNEIREIGKQSKKMYDKYKELKEKQDKEAADKAKKEADAFKEENKDIIKRANELEKKS